MSKVVITIGREFGSRGREIGIKLGEKLKIPVYDKDIIKIGAWNDGMLDEKYIEMDSGIDDRLYGYDTGKYPLESGDADSLFRLQARTIKRLAEDHSCIFIGRCADYVLEGMENCINVFIYAPYSERYYYLLDKYGLTEEETKKMITKVDKDRHTYYKHITGHNRGERNKKQLEIDSSYFGVEGTVNIILAAVENVMQK